MNGTDARVVPMVDRSLILGLRTDPLTTFMEIRRVYGDVCQYQIGDRIVWLVSRPSEIKRVLVDMNTQMRRTKLTRQTLGRFLGDGLTTSAGDEHRKNRGLIQPHFTPAWTEKWRGDIISMTDTMMDKWTDGETRDIADDMNVLSRTIACRIIFGASDDQNAQDARTAIGVLQQHSADAMIGAATVGDDVIEDARDTLRRAAVSLLESKDTGNAFTERLKQIVSQGGMTQEQAAIEAVHLYVAGQETSANALAWTWWLLGQGQEHLQSLESASESFESASQRGENDQQAELTILDIVKESLRLMPPAWLIGREAIEDVTIGGYEVSAGHQIAISPYVVHRQAEHHPNPEMFDPSRFERAEPPRYAYIPFGAGPHICLGNHLSTLEMETILTRIAARWHIEVDRTHDPKPLPLITLRASAGVQAIVHKKAGRA